MIGQMTIRVKFVHTGKKKTPREGCLLCATRTSGPSGQLQFSMMRTSRTPSILASSSFSVLGRSPLTSMML